MTVGKQVFLCAGFLSAYSSLSMCMEQQVSEQKLDFDSLPLNVQEQIMRYLPADNLYRALWSRDHNGSQQFYDDTVKAYLESHFVPQQLVDKTVAQDFAYFRGSKQQKQKFQEKIKQALQRYGQNDTALFAQYKQHVSDHQVEMTDAPFSGRMLELLMKVINSTEDKRAQIVIRLKAFDRLAQLKKPLQKRLSCVTCFRAYLPIFKSTINKAVLKRVLHTLIDKHGEVPVALTVAIISGYSISTFLGVISLDSAKPTEIFTIWFYFGILFSIVAHSIIKDSNLLSTVDYDNSLDYYLLACSDKLAELQTKISQVLDTIEQVEKA